MRQQSPGIPRRPMSRADRSTGGRSRFSPKVRARAVAMVNKRVERYDSEWAAFESVAAEIGCAAETVRRWVRNSEAEEDRRLGITTAERKRRKEFEAEVVRRIKPFTRLNHEQLLLRPKTVIDDLAKRAADELSRLMDESGLERLASVFPQLTPAEHILLQQRADEHVAKERQSVGRDPAGAELLRLMADAHRGVRNAPLLVTPHPREHGLALLEAYGRMEELRGSRGEHRARLLTGAIQHIADAVYQPYVEGVWKLGQLRLRSLGKLPRQFSSLIDESRALVPEYPHLVEADAAHVRNAIAHPRENFKYLPEENAVWLHDRSGWTRTFALSELEDLCWTMIQVAGVLFPKAMNAFREDAIWRHALVPFSRLMTAMQNKDAKATDHWAEAFRTAMDSPWSDIERLVATSSASP